MSKLSRLARRWLSCALIAIGVFAAYLLNVEVQSALGRRALAATELVSLPLPEALVRAETEGKVVLVAVSAIWCPTCRRLDQTVFADAAVRERVGATLVFSRLEYESAEGQAFLEQHQASGFPTLWLLDASGQVVRRLELTFDPAAFLAQLPVSSS